MFIEFLASDFIGAGLAWLTYKRIHRKRLLQGRLAPLKIQPIDWYLYKFYPTRKATRGDRKLADLAMRGIRLFTRTRAFEHAVLYHIMKKRQPGRVFPKSEDVVLHL